MRMIHHCWVQSPLEKTGVAWVLILNWCISRWLPYYTLSRIEVSLLLNVSLNQSTPVQSTQYILVQSRSAPPHIYIRDSFTSNNQLATESFNATWTHTPSSSFSPIYSGLLVVHLQQSHILNFSAQANEWRCFSSHTQIYKYTTVAKGTEVTHKSHSG